MGDRAGRADGTGAGGPEREAVAIIGVACALPGAGDLAALHENLRTGQVAFGAPAPERVRHAGGDPALTYAPSAYLDRIDLFDHHFFGLSRREADLMDPHQRLVLHLVHQAVENACYAPGALRGTRTAVVLSAPNPEYAGLLPDDDPRQILGTLPSAISARVAYLLDLTGPVLAVDTACSGSLAALAGAVAELRADRADMAVAGGVSLQTLLRLRSGYDPLPGIESPDGVCRPFDAEADGTAGGEGGGIVVLKRLSRAVADHDVIHAVVRGVAVNHNGYRAASMSAPSKEAQAEVITAAWRDAGVPLGTAGYFECHGSGTPLGDLIEAGGLRTALEAAGAAGGPAEHRWIGAVKGNLGHLDHASGMAGLCKVLAGLRHSTLYPTAGFRTPNAALGPQGPLRVATEARPWHPPGDGLPRRAGLSSFGLTGTNVHVVIEEPPVRRHDDRPRTGGTELVTVSAASATALDRRTELLADFLAGSDLDLAAVAHALNRGRDDLPHRRAFTVPDVPALLTALRTPVASEHRTPAAPVVLLFSGDGDVGAAPGQDQAFWRRLREEFPALAAAEDSFGPEPEHSTDARILMVRQLSLYRLAESLGLATGRLVGAGPGNLAVRVVRGRTATGDALREAAGTRCGAHIDDRGLRRAVKDFLRDGALLVELGRDGALTRRIRELAPELTVVPLIDDTGRAGVLAALATLYERGAGIDWERHYAGRHLPRAELPTYPFESVSCWHGPQEAARTGRELRTPAASPGPAAVDAPADLERAVADLWARALKAPDVGPGSDYFELGGNSLAGVTLFREAGARFGVRLTFDDLYRHRTVREMAALIGRRRAEGGAPAEAPFPVLPAGARIPLSYNQEQLWYLDKLTPAGPLYNIPGDIRYTGPLDVAALRAALRDVVARHDVLRTRIEEERGVPSVRYDAPCPVLDVVDVRGLPDPERETRRLVGAEARAPFDLAAGPLLRTTLVRQAEQEHVLLVTWHHIVFDGWSPVVFFRDLAACYAARKAGEAPTLPELRVQYGDFAAWQRSWLDGDRLARGLGWWRRQLAGLRPAELPLDRPRPAVQSHAGDLLRFELPPEHGRRLRDFSGQEGVTTFVTLLAVVDALLHLWAGHGDVVVGAATSGRYHRDTHDLIGFFNNVLPFRTRVDGGLTFRQLVRRCAETVTGVLDHEEVPFGKIIADLRPRRDPARHPLYTVGYTHQNTAAHSEALDGLTAAPGTGTFGGIAPGTSKVDLTIGVNDEDGGPMVGYLEYAVDLFDRATMEQLARSFQDLIGAALDDPDRKLTDLAPATPRPAPTVAVLRGADRPVPAEPVHAVVARRAAEDPDRPAVVDDATGRTHTYAEIDARADRIARRLRAAGTRPGTTVPVKAARGAELVAGWLGVLKAGAAFVPVDPALPPARVTDMLGPLDCPVVVLGEGQESPCPGAREVPTGPHEPGGRAWHTDPPAAPGLDEPAYVAFTSGSTGRPHGCEVTHRSVLNLLTWYGTCTGLGPADQVAQTLPTGFDASILETLAALLHGATLHVLHDALLSPATLLRWLAEHRITVTCLPTALTEVVLREYPAVPDLALRVLVTGGDRLRVRPPEHAPFRLLNLYGPTECAVTATWTEVLPGPDADPPGIGVPIDNTAAYVLGPDGRPCAPGEVGELYLGGVAVGRGYHRLPGRTAARFLPDPFAAGPGARMYRTGDLASLAADGTLRFHGRSDDQLEIRGHRVEPAEIERVLLAHPGIREAVVLPSLPEHDAGTVGLTAHLAGDRLPPAAEVTTWVAARLPAPMVPGRVVAHHGRLPRTTSGKTDRKGMMSMQNRTGPDAPGHAEAAGLVQSTAEAERILAGIWADILRRDAVAPHDDFFAIGGDSVLSVAVAARAEAAGLSVTPHDLISRPVLRDLAAGALPAGPDATPAVPAPPAAADDGPLPLTPLMHGLLDNARDGGRDFVVAEVLETDGTLGAEALRAAFDRLLELHEPLRFRFRRNAVSRRIESPGAQPPPAPLDVKVLPTLDEGAELALLEADKDELIADIDPFRGAMLRARLYDRGPGRTDLLTLVVHHFAYDHISAVPLLEDLNAALRTPAGAPGADPGDRRAWRAWSRHLTAMADSDEVAGEAAYWTAVLEGGRAAGGPPDRTEAPAPRPGGPLVVRRALAGDQVAKALRESGAEGREAALAAAACAWSRWTGSPDAYLMTVGEGTPNALRPSPRSRSVGWFTNSFPVLLPAGGRRADEALADTARRLRAVPNDGVGYGILRRLSPAGPVTDRLRALPEPQVLVEHTATGGDALKVGDGPVWIRSEPLVVQHHSLLAYMPFAVSSMMMGGELVIHLVHDGTTPADRLEELADHLVDAFAELAGER
ncbi:amino acid adenylation domain-containing protein [Streptomyces noursei]|uniref:amino acid adenylation domain-containing protein n=1 Tax=Streptomyces noursei TaxID=1971 RepID=UPI0037F1FC2C